LSLKLSDARVYEPQIRARLGTTGGLNNIYSFVPSENGLAAYLSKAADIEAMEQPPMAVRTALRKEPQCPADFL